MLTKFMNANSASTLGLGSLPSNTVANPKGDMKAITTRSGVSYDGPQVPPPPSSLPKVVEHEPEVTKDTVHPSTENIQPPEEKLREKDDLLVLKFMEMFRNLHFELSFADALFQMPKFAPMFRKLLNNKDKIIDLIKTPVNVNCSAVILKKFLEKLRDPGRFLIPYDFSEMDECLALADLGASINLMPLSVWTARALIDVHDEQMTLRHEDQSITFKVGDTKTFSYNTIESVNRVDVIDVACEEFAQEVLGFLNISKSEIEACLTSKSIPPGIDDADFDLKEDLLTLERLLNSDPTSTLPPKKQKFEDLKTVEPSNEDKTALFKVLRSHKRAIAWKMLDIKGIDPKFYTHKILMEDNVKPTVQHQRRVNPKFHEVIKKEVIKLLEAGLIYPISDSPYMMAIFHDMIEETMEVSDDISVLLGFLLFKPSSHLDKNAQKIDASDFEVGAVLGKLYTDHSTLKYLLAKQDAKPRLLLICDKKGAENLAADHLSRLENPYQSELEKKEITETFPLETLGMVTFHGDDSTSWFADFANYHAGNFV
ncbi:hypothetical protein Tco_0064473 [Tanacetum coccineum]